MAAVDLVARDLGRPNRGLVRTTDLVDAGVAASTVTRRVKSGVWLRPVRGVVDVTGERWCWERRVVLAILACPPGTVASHSTAAALHGLGDIPRTGGIDVTVPRQARSRALPFRVHSTIRPDPAPTVVDGIPVASVARACLGLASSITGDRALHRAVRDALRRGLVTVDALRDNDMRGLPGRVRLADVTSAEWETALHAVESPLEDEAVELLRTWPVPAFVTQHPVQLGPTSLRIDIAWPDRFVALEVQSAAYHSDALARACDDWRTLQLREDDWTVIPAWSRDLVGRRADRLRDRLLTALAAEGPRLIC